jgi:hypothetical protein
MKDIHQHILKTLENETNWFSQILDRQFKIYFNQAEEGGEPDRVHPPDLSGDDSYYALLVKEYSLGYQERLAMMLALMPHLRPNLLDIFFTRNSHFDRGFTEFGGFAGKRHSGFLPTGETLHFLLNRGALTGRLETEALLGPDQVLARKDILRLERAESYEPVLSGALTVTEEFMSYLVTGQRHVPATSEVFPARLVTTGLEWDDLVINKEVLDEIGQLRQWIQSEKELMKIDAFRKHVKPGYRALFYGPPGTGKTLTACLLGKATGLDVYRIDLSLVVSKYIGETEKNLGRIFDYAERRKWILFFDEADALFGKRTQTHSSNDRHANQEVSYLLQRMEDFPGTVILASNLRSNIDEAFSRRFQSMIYFPMPTAEQRLALWKQFFSGSIMPDHDLDLSWIAGNYELSGGSAINVFRYSVLKAAARRSERVQQEDVLQGIKKEYQKYGKTIKP